MGCRASTQLFYYFCIISELFSFSEQNHQKLECCTNVCVCVCVLSVQVWGGPLEIRVERLRLTYCFCMKSPERMAPGLAGSRDSSCLLLPVVLSNVSIIRPSMISPCGFMLTPPLQVPVLVVRGASCSLSLLEI